MKRDIIINLIIIIIYQAASSYCVVNFGNVLAIKLLYQAVRGNIN